jgi:DNA-binding NtrC family response regulator
MNNIMASSQKTENILIVDDSPDTLEVIQRNLISKGYTVFTAPGVEEGMEILESTVIDLVVTDFKMPKASGFDLIKFVRENLKNTEIIMITGYASIEGAVKALKIGAEEYLAKPFTDDELFAAVKRALNKLKMRTVANGKLEELTSLSFGLIGDSEVMREVYGTISKVASSNANILITGESGTGKELVARAIHYSGTNASSPFVPVNCGGIPENLLESELFGYVKGSFTGAAETRAGFFQTADGGTIFLDEVSETSLAMQVKLLRVLQDKEVYMIGAKKPHKVNVRILAATNKDLTELINKNLFREDLFFRLNVISIQLPPLRDRGDDILILANNFAKSFADQEQKKVPKFSDRALNILKNYYWPGNVRELENVIQRLVLMTESDLIDAPDLPNLMRFTQLRNTGFNRTLAEIEYEYVKNVLASVNGNKTQAAKILGIDRKTLRDKLKQ